MPITLSCPSCTRKLTAKDEHVGRVAKCPSCQTLVTIPSAKPPQPVQPPTPPLVPPLGSFVAPHASKPSVSIPLPSPSQIQFTDETLKRLAKKYEEKENALHY